MTSKASVKREIQMLVAELESLGGSRPSKKLKSALDSDADIVVKKSETRIPRSSASGYSGDSIRATKPRKRGSEDVAKSISEISARLRQAFESDASFEAGVRDLEASDLTKAHVIEIYRSVIGTSKTFPKSVTKAALLKALRKDRITKIRAAS